MRKQIALSLAFTPLPLSAATNTDLLLGTFTNEEQIYFDHEAGKPVAPWMGVQVTKTQSGVRFHPIDVYGAAAGPDNEAVVVFNGNQLTMASGGCARSYAVTSEALTASGNKCKCEGSAMPASMTKRSRWPCPAA